MPTDITLADRVRRAADHRGGHPALIGPRGTMTWAELDASVDRVARTLRTAVPRPPGGGPAARVAIALGNSAEFAIAFFAVLRAGLVAVPVYHAGTGPELRHVLADSGATLLLGTEQVTELARGVEPELPVPVLVHTGLPAEPGGGPATPDAADPVAVGGDDLAVLLYTSGTEGRPRGAMLTHRALLANHEQIGRIEPAVVVPDDTVLLALPLFHAYGLNSGLGAVAYHGACGVLVDRFDPVATLELVTRHRISVLVGVPAMFASWTHLAGRREPGDLARAMSTVRLAVCGAAALDPVTAARFTELAKCPVHVGYGLTETAPVLTSTLVGPVSKPGSIGRPLPGVELRLLGSAGEDLRGEDGAGLVDEEPEEDEPDLVLSSPGTDPGQILVRGANLFSGYWPDRRDGPGPTGWWATRDVAYADADGDLYLVDRLGDLIIVNGFNVYPREVELVLEAHPGVAEAAVVGLTSQETGQSIKAYVLPVPGGVVDADELSAHCARNLARFKCPNELEFVTELPRSVIGKVRRTELRSATVWRPAGTAPVVTVPTVTVPTAVGTVTESGCDEERRSR